MEQLIFIAIVVVVGLIRLIAQAAENKKNADAERQTGTAPAAETLAPRVPQTEEERVRKFLEALGVPTSSDPPPKVQPRPVAPPAVPKRTIMPVDPFPSSRGRTPEPRPPSPAVPPLLPAPPPIPQVRPLPTRETTVLRKVRKLETEQTRAANFEVRDIDEALAEDAFSHAGLRIDDGKSKGVIRPGIGARLATEDGLRDAIILREIFGPPRSMQPSERA